MKKTICIILMFLVLFSSFGHVVQGAVIACAEEENYIVMTNSPYAATQIVNDFGGEVLKIDKTICSVSANSYEASALKLEDDVVYVEEDIIFTASSETNSSMALNQWYLDAISVEENVEGGNIKVAVLDSGVDCSSDLSVECNINFVPDGNESAVFNDCTGHGSAVAGIIGAARNETGIDGINPEVELYSVKVLDSDNKSPLNRIIDGIYWSIENDIDIINMSFGTDIDSDILHNAIIDAYNAGILLIAAAGNTQHQDVQFPAAYDEVISVGSVSSSGELSKMTSVNNQLDILAPGENILTSSFLDTVSTLSGTSMAAAQVTGIASLIWAKDISKSNRFVMELICSAVNKPSTLEGVNAGIVNFEAAIAAYDDFSSNYKELESIETDFSVNEVFDYSDESSVIVDGLWGNVYSSEGHEDLTDTATTEAGFQGYAPSIVRYACTNLDRINLAEYQKYKNKLEHFYAGAPHGIGNYVINLRFLYLASRVIYDNGVGVDYSNLVDSFTNNANYWNVNWHTDNPDFDKIRFKYMVKQVNHFLETKELLVSNVKNNFDSYSTVAQNRYLGCMIFGMALHLAGDMYAHRTIVPTYTIAGVNGNENTKIDEGRYLFGGKYFDVLAAEDFYDTESNWSAIKELCRLDSPNSDGTDDYLLYWQYFQRGVALQVMEFRDINMFLLDEYKGTKNPFEDNAGFSAERYSASTLSCVRLAKRFKEAGSFYPKLIYPKDFAEGADNTQYQYVKLNNFKSYTIASGLNYIGVNLSESDWEINSTTTLV